MKKKYFFPKNMVDECHNLQPLNAEAAAIGIL